MTAIIPGGANGVRQNIAERRTINKRVSQKGCIDFFVPFVTQTADYWFYFPQYQNITSALHQENAVQTLSHKPIQECVTGNLVWGLE